MIQLTQYETSVNPGDIVQYHEDGGVIRIKIIDLTIDNDWLKIKFEVLEIIVPDDYGTDPSVGEILTVEKNIKEAPYVSSLLWHLRPIE